MRRDGTDIPADAWADLLPPAKLAVPSCSLIRPSIPYGPRTALVIGAFRGGTSFIAELLIECGVFIGDRFPPPSGNDYDCLEDVDFWEAIQDIFLRSKQSQPQSNEWRYLRQVIDERNAARELWGFKYPSTVFIIDQLLPLLRNPHLLVIVRDPLSTWQGSQARDGWMDWGRTRHHVACVLDLIEKPRGPTLAISYERGKERPGEVREAIKEFLGL